MKSVAAVLVLGLIGAGCASSPGIPAGMKVVKDEQRIAAIERAAARSGVKVYWVNGPTKLVPESGS